MSDELGRSVGLKRTRNGYDDDALQHSSAKKGIVKTFWARNHSEGVELNFNWYVESCTTFELRKNLKFRFLGLWRILVFCHKKLMKRFALLNSHLDVTCIVGDSNSTPKVNTAAKATLLCIWSGLPL